MDRSEFEKLCGNILAKSGREFLTLAQLNAKLPAKTQKELGLAKKSSGTQIEKAISPMLDDAFVILKKGSSKYLAKNIPLEEIVHAAIERSPGKSPGQIGQYLPMVKKVFAEKVNLLLQQGRARVELTPDFAPKLFHAPLDAIREKAVPATVATTVPTTVDDRAQFQAAYQRLDRGRFYVPIFEVRRELGWSRERFDLLLETLRDAAVIQLHAGDVISMTDDQVKDSFLDDNGFLHLTVTWRAA